MEKETKRALEEAAAAIEAELLDANTRESDADRAREDAAAALRPVERLEAVFWEVEALTTPEFAQRVRKAVWDCYELPDGVAWVNPDGVEMRDKEVADELFALFSDSFGPTAANILK